MRGGAATGGLALAASSSGIPTAVTTDAECRISNILHRLGSHGYLMSGRVCWLVKPAFCDGQAPRSKPANVRHPYQTLGTRRPNHHHQQHARGPAAVATALGGKGSRHQKLEYWGVTSGARSGRRRGKKQRGVVVVVVVVVRGEHLRVSTSPPLHRWGRFI